MTGLTHGLAGAVVGAVISGDPLVSVVGAVAALVPDIDEPRSLLGSRLPVVSIIAKRLLGHRGITHTVIAAALLSILALGIAPYLGVQAIVCALIVFLSALSHVALDALTPSGTQALWPLPQRFSGPIRTGGITELPITLLLGCVLWLALKGA